MFDIASETFKTAKEVTIACSDRSDGIKLAGCSLNIAQQRDTAQDPVIRVLRTLQIDRSDVREISSPRLLIDRTRIHLQVNVFGQMGGDEDDGQWLEEDLWLRFSESSAAPVPPRPF